MGDIQQDPSMEEILASIKRVIREDGRPAAQARASRRNGQAVAPAVAAPPADEDVLELDDPMDSAEDDGLISDNVAAASRQSLAALTAVRTPPPATPPTDGGALENVVRDMLRPMLKEWLEEHLPQIVEELVTREITRITGRNL
jgi:cell pole-organizing protein PopZ